MTYRWAALGRLTTQYYHMLIIWWYILAIISFQRETIALGTLPDASQEGLLWQFKSYSSVALFHFNVPPEVTRATWEFAATQSLCRCIFLCHN